MAFGLVVLLFGLSLTSPLFIDHLPLPVLLTLAGLSYLCLLGWLLGTLWIIKHHRTRFPWWMTLYVLSSPMVFAVGQRICCFGPCHSTLQAAMAEALQLPIYLLGFMPAMGLALFLLSSSLNRPAVRRILGQGTLLGLPCLLALMASLAAWDEGTILGVWSMLAVFFVLPLITTALTAGPLSQKVAHYVGLLFIQFLCGILLLWSLVVLAIMGLMVPFRAYEAWNNFDQPPPPIQYIAKNDQGL